ncbi:MAG TPA: hypothetical protein PKD51_17620 [Saprospiraceae bacterium]|nr:hypothetical protein [Saprospiraceae bacterium]HMU02951.1 hypothetical protein [Saprospiraceae bacterium]
MNRKYFIVFIISTLMISNLIQMYYLSQKPNKDKEPRDIIIEVLKFDENQTAEYDKLIAVHKKQIRERNEQINQLKNNLYQLLPADTISKSTVDSLASEIGSIQQNIEHIHFDHFKDIKSLCKPSQREDFIKLSLQLQQIFHSKRNPKNKHQ